MVMRTADPTTDRLGEPVAESGCGPRATYRLQFHKDFTFAAARDLAGYLGEIGVSHVYSSPVLTARAGSAHGYDVVDYDAINPELGGEAGFRELAAALREHGIGIILDIVPNHMAVGGADNRLWLDLLKHGRASLYAGWFDIDFDCPDPALAGKVHAPFLGRPYAEELHGGSLALIAAPDGTGYAIRYGEHLFPTRPDHDSEIAAAGLAAFADPVRLDTLISRQNYLLDWWRNAGDRINWRRFFDITQLAAMRMEEPAAFSAKHAVALRLYREGLIDGLRIDHVDGLGDPANYCRQLRRALDSLQSERPVGQREQRAWLVVEKILASSEHLPPDWDVDGSTGYDFMDQVSAFQHRGTSKPALEQQWAAISGRVPTFHGEEEIARHEILSHSFSGQRERLIDALEQAGAFHRDADGITRAALGRAVTSLLVQLRAYRSYATGRGDGSAPGERLQAALLEALARPLSDAPALNFVASVISGEGDEAHRPARVTAIRRFNQLSAPLAAKAVEDTAFYRYGRLLSRNDVGFDAGTLGIDPATFHELMRQRACGARGSMLATATHDHKRGEDLRARLAVLSEMPGRWAEATSRWHELNAPLRPAGFSGGDEYMFYQMLVGAWPFDVAADDSPGLAGLAARLVDWQRKALREAKLRSSWAAPNAVYERAAEDFVAVALDPARSEVFLAEVLGFVQAIAPAGAVNGLVQLALRCTAPGIPDTYQGCEFWDFSLVDPDNRRPVDFAARQSALAQRLPLDRLATTWREGPIKQALLQRLLILRRDEPGLFACGSYEPLAVSGIRSEHVLAFLRRRGDAALLVVVARTCADAMTGPDRLAPEPAWWGDTRMALPDRLVATHATVGPELRLGGSIALADALPVLPVGVWRLRRGV